MDESYLHWLQWIPGIGAEKARRIAERFPTFEHLRAATREELTTIEGLTSADVEALNNLMRDGSGRDDSGHLFLCPECGSFAGAGASSCPVCGVEFREEEAVALPRGLEDFLLEEERPAAICLTCGAAMASGQPRCDVCSREYTADELAILPGLNAFVDEAAPLCPHCGAYLYGDATECAICGRATLEVPEPATNGHREKGIGRGFLSRWQKVAETAEVSAEDRLREELENCDRLLDADPTLERTWAKRGRVLGELGRLSEATESIRRAAELNPAKEEEYRLEVLDILRAHGDMSFLPPKWRQPAATAAPRKVDERLLEALRHYDDLLRIDPNAGVAWRTKGEILERLGRSAEAREALARADWLERHEGQSLKAAVAGLQSRGMVPSRISEGGRANGRANGRTNGHVNGRTNGRINGFTNGRVNGITNGAVNGLNFGSGRTNGIEGWGRTNGLVNGNGFTNGRRGRYGPPHIPSQPHWARSVVGIAAVVALMILAPILASLFSPSPTLQETIRIDHDFSDWSKLSVYQNSATHFSPNPDVNLVRAKVASSDSDLFVYAQVQGSLFRGFGINETDSVFVFVDEDGNRATGYPIGDLGADVLAEVTGWDDTIQTVARYRFDNSGVVTSNDWNRFVPSDSAAADFNGNELEMRIPVGRDPLRARVLLYGADNRGDRSPMDGSIRVARPTLVVDQQTIVSDPVANLTAPVLRVGFTTMGGIVHVTALNLTRQGSSTDPADVAAFLDDGSGSFDAADLWISSTPLAGTRSTVSIDRTLSSSAVVWLVARWSNMTPASTFGLRVDDIWSNGTASFRPPETSLVYLSTAPPSPTVDGAFGDWRGRTYGQDLLGDVVNRSGSLEYNANVDLLKTAVDLSFNFTAFMQVDGRILGGEDIPVERIRTYPVSGGNVSNISPPAVVQEGVDVLYAYIDADNASTTGLWASVGNRTYGFDYAMAAVGRNGAVNSSGLFRYAPTNNATWRYVGSMAVALDAHRMEFGMNASTVNLQPGYRVVFYAADWRLEYDVALPDVAVGRFALAAQAATNVVINEVSPQPNPEWVEVANPTGSAVNLAGWDLALQRGNKMTVVYTFTNQVLGAWGSGTEYLRVFVPSNSLPNGNNQVSLRQNSNVIDQTTYSQSVANGQSWSRFKDPTTGVPMDTNSDAADFYISLLPSPGAANDRHRPIITVAKIVSATTAVPGNTLTYTIYYNNTGTGAAKYVWINDTLPASVTFVSSSDAPSTVSPPVYGWTFTTVAPGPHALTITVQANANGADGSRQVNRATLAYTDQVRRPMTGSQAWANFTLLRPTIVVAKTASPANALPGEIITYIIYYNNTGSLTAGTVTIKDVLPSSVTYSTSNPAPSGTSGQTLWWNFTTVGVGAHSIMLTATVNAGATGPLLVNWVFLNYTTTGGYQMPSSSASAIVSIPELSDFIFVIAVPFLIVGLRFRSSRKQKGSSEEGEKEEGVADSVPWIGGR